MASSSRVLLRWASTTQTLGFRRRAATHGGEAFRPHPREDGTKRWLRPALSRRKWKVARKQALLNGTFGSFSEEAGGWLPEWDEVKEPRILYPHKKHKRERTREARADKIDEAMEIMPDKIREYRDTVKARKPPPGIESLIKRLGRRRN